MKVYYYSLSSHAQWSSMDYGYVLANSSEDAKQLASEHIKKQYDKVNELLKDVANFGFDPSSIEIVESKELPNECFNYNPEMTY
jgi:hypothetical protein